jgi:peroxiredoxin Q/BCP
MLKTTASLLALAALIGLSTACAQEGSPVREGDMVPNVTLPATGSRKQINLQDLKGKKVVLFFYPKAMTPGCTRESCAFRDLSKEFAAADTIVLGISTDKVEAQEQFTKKESLNFPLLADNEMKLSKALGVLDEKRGLSRRATFVIDKDGKIAKIYPAVKDVVKHPDEVLGFVKTLK